jgi:hypothetical protein
LNPLEKLKPGELFSSTLAALPLMTCALQGQDNRALGKFKRISSHRLQQLTRQPDGIEEVAKRVGYFDWRDEGEVWELLLAME